MAPMKLLIADGHHRYETSLNYRGLHPSDPAAQYVMMTFVNMYSPGLLILATHRVLRNLEKFDMGDLLAHADDGWAVHAFDSIAALKHEMETAKPHTVRIGVVTAKHLCLLER